MKISIVNFPWFSKISSSNWAGIKSQENHSFVNVMFNCLFANVTLNHIKKLIGLIWMFYWDGSYPFLFWNSATSKYLSYMKTEAPTIFLGKVNINSSLQFYYIKVLLCSDIVISYSLNTDQAHQQKDHSNIQSTKRNDKKCSNSIRLNIWVIWIFKLYSLGLLLNFLRFPLDAIISKCPFVVGVKRYINYYRVKNLVWTTRKKKWKIKQKT